MYDSPFTPLGPTYAVGQLPVQILASGGQPYSSMRVFNTTNIPVRIGYVIGPTNPGAVSTVTPAAGSPATVITILASGKETLCLPQNCWVQASVSILEVTPGEGMV